jgi:hypothetical protein
VKKIIYNITFILVVYYLFYMVVLADSIPDGITVIFH